MIFGHQRAGRRCGGSPAPSGVIDLVLGTEVQRWTAMTVQAELHRESLGLVAKRHAVDFAVTARTADALGYVDTVVEVDIIRQIIDSVPGNRTIIGKALAHRRKNLSIRPDLRMTRHASVGWRQACV